MFELSTQLGKDYFDLHRNQRLTATPVSVLVCVGDMNSEQGEKLVSELPG